MFNNLVDTIKNFDIKIKKILKNGLYFSLLVSVIRNIFIDLLHIFFTFKFHLLHRNRDYAS